MSEPTIDVGYEVTHGGQKKHVWLKPEDVARYCDCLRRQLAAVTAERDALLEAGRAVDAAALRFERSEPALGRALPLGDWSREMEEALGKLWLALLDNWKGDSPFEEVDDAHDRR